MPRAWARARNAAIHCSNAALLPCAGALVLHAAIAPASKGRHARRDRRTFINFLIAPHPGIDFVPWDGSYSCFCRLCDQSYRPCKRGRRGGLRRKGSGGNLRADLLLDFLSAAADQPLIG